MSTMTQDASPASAATVSVRYVAQAALAAGVAREEAPMPQDRTLDGLLAALAARHEGLARLLGTANEKAIRAVLVFVNDHQADRTRPVQLQDKDQVLVLAPMAGG